MSGLADHLAAASPDWPRALIETVAAEAETLRAPDGARVFGPGDPCERFVVVLSGIVRVEQIGSGGRSIVLYRVGPGDSCVMTTSGLLSGVPYDAWGIAEGAVEILALPAAAFRSLIDADAEFRARVLSVFSHRILELSQVIDDLLLRRVDLRLAGWLVERTADGGTLTATHQSIASELGSAREVISRILKDFERRGWVALRRGAIEVRERDALRRLETGVAL
ncbi:MAG: Crp/Fnr family transcriptional regulator [Pseudomonadota bacterium]